LFVSLARQLILASVPL
jgi:hypothetical protein